MKMEYEVVAHAPPPSQPGGGGEKAGVVTKPQPGVGHGHDGEDDEGEHEHDHASHGKTVHAHAFLLSFGFLFLLPLGVLAGRWGRTISPVWFKVHWILNMAVAAPVIALGWILGPIAVWQHGVGHLDDAHKICGFIILGLYGGQVLLGRYIHQKRVEKVESGVPIKSHHPLLNVGHVAFGLLFIASAFFQVRSGLNKLQYEPEETSFVMGYRKVWAIWSVVSLFILAWRHGSLLCL